MPKALVYVTFKAGVLDPQGEAVRGALSSLGFKGVNDVRVGKFIEIELEDTDDILADLERMCQDLLANPVIEDYRIEIANESKNGEKR
ncbi:MAG: phosphoribosylformylglycinamidine synthase subunit PurS [Nitrospinae bacterium]|nr:phosphoribosylformylglycinamidine synthase subunit PurS [Nitrospinota bacterium]